MKVYRHGDILITPVDTIPVGAQPRTSLVLARGEITGHAHRVETDDRVELFEHPDGLFLRVLGSSARVIHEEHNPIELGEGIYRIWRQREYNPSSYEELIED